MPRIAVLIPCWNEALTIEKVVTDFRAVLPEADIYVYDNNSTDGTAEPRKLNRCLAAAPCPPAGSGRNWCR